jgi:two-component system, NtrC family, sensor kinase
MNRRSKTGDEPIKGRRPKTPKPTRRNAPKVEIRTKPSPVAEEKEVARLARERDEALKQQTATSDVLRVISASSGELEPVFSAMLERAVRLCGAKFGNIYRWDGEALHILASHNTPPAFAGAVRRSPYRPYQHSPIGRMVADRTVVHINDVMEEEVYLARRDPMAMSAVALGGIRTLLGVPLLNKGEMIGAFFLSHQEVRPFTDKQIALVQNFADQAVIAIENARLLNELRQSLEQQTATAEVLRIISTSPNDLHPVFRTMLTNATRLCEADFGQLLLHQGDGHFLNVAMHNAPPAFVELRRREPIVRASRTLARVATERLEFLHVADCTEDASYKRGDADFVKFVDLCEVRTLLGAPLRKDGELIGVIGIYRKEVRPFTEKQIALLRGFADQAVIAIENARLLNELRQRTTDLTEALDQQTATSEVLQVISGSPGDLQPVFATMLEKAVSVCEAGFGSMVLREGSDIFRRVALHNAPPEFQEFHEGTPTLRLSDASSLDQVLSTRQAVQVADLQAQAPETPLAKYGGARTLLNVPLLKENEVVGAFGVFRQELRLFSDKQIALVQNFAAQAVIAIENARLLNELRQSLEQQTATSQVLQVTQALPAISSRCLQQYWRTPPGSARPSSAHFILTKAMAFAPLRCTTRHPPMRRRGPASYIHIPALAFGARQTQGKRCRSPT